MLLKPTDLGSFATCKQEAFGAATSQATLTGQELFLASVRRSRQEQACFPKPIFP
jgi:hypothetical protein